MGIVIQSYNDELERKWEYFVTHSENGTLFHLRKFLGYHRQKKFTDASVIFYREQKITAVMPAVIQNIYEERVFFSHPGASYGGLVIGEKTGLEDVCEMVDLLTTYARKRECQRIIITQPPLYYFRKQSSYIDFALHINGFHHKKRELSSILTLNQPAETIYRQFPPELKRALRKAHKSGLYAKKQHEIGEYFYILENNLSMRHNVKPTHTREELEILFTLFPDRIKLYSVNMKGKMVGGVVTFACNARVNLAFYIAHNHDYQQYRPVDLIIWELIQDSIKQGFTFLDFGTFTLNMEPNWGLCRFKEKFGARGVFRNTFERRF